MVKADFHPFFKKEFSKLKNKVLKERIINQLIKIRENPEIGKPMKFNRKGTREVYIGSFRLSYIYHKEENKIIILDIYHKDEQ